MGHNNLSFFLISIVLLICSMRVTKSQNIELYCRKYASDLKCEVSNYISENMTVSIKKISSKTLQQKQLEDAPVLIISRDHQIESLPQGIGQHFKQLKELIVNLLGLKIIRRTDFNELSSLKTLNLANNNITEIPSNAFQDLENLVILFINGNKIKKIEPMLLKKMKMLRAFNAQHNQLEELQDIFTENLQLESISLNNNKLSKIEINFTSFIKIKNIDLRNNHEICTRCTMRNQKALNRTSDICDADDDKEKKKNDNQFANCVMETMKTNKTFEEKLSECTKATSYVQCVMGRLNENSDEKKFFEKCLIPKKNTEKSIKENSEVCLFCKNNINDITEHAKLCDLRYSEFSHYNITTFGSEVQKFF